MTPLFDADLRLAGFFDGTYLFDAANEWVAFHDRGNVFARAGRWLGPLRDGTFQDHDGRPVAFLSGARPATGMKPPPPGRPRLPLPPRRPLRPRTPLPPARPLQPGGGWSALSWAQWLGTEALPAAAPAAAPAPRIEVVDEAALDGFFTWLGEHLADNGRDGTWFQPLAAHPDGVPPERRHAFRAGLSAPVGEPGWRRAWVARDADGRVLGHVDLRAHPEPFTGHRCLLGLGVRRERRRQGLARRLLAHATDWGREQGLGWIDLRVLSQNEAAVTLYRAEGFQMQGGTPDMFRIDGQSLGWLSMARKLAP